MHQEATNTSINYRCTKSSVWSPLISCTQARILSIGKYILRCDNQSGGHLSCFTSGMRLTKRMRRLTETTDDEQIIHLSRLG